MIYWNWDVSTESDFAWVFSDVFKFSLHWKKPNLDLTDAVLCMWLMQKKLNKHSLEDSMFKEKAIAPH